MKELVLLSVLGTLAAALIALIMGKRAKNAEGKALSLQNLLNAATEGALLLNEAQGKTTGAEEKANEKRKSLADTPDSGLADRANKLF